MLLNEWPHSNSLPEILEVNVTELNFRQHHAFFHGLLFPPKGVIDSCFTFSINLRIGN